MITLLLILYFILNVVDIFTTSIGLSHGGTELNPFLKWTMDKIGILPALFTHKGVVTIIVVIFYITEIFGWWFNFGLLMVLDAIYIWVAIHNFKQLNKLKNEIFKS